MTVCGSASHTVILNEPERPREGEVKNPPFRTICTVNANGYGFFGLRASE